MNQKNDEKTSAAEDITPMPLAEIRLRLKTMNLRAVALEAGVSADSVYRIANGEGDPKHSTIQKVTAFLRKHAAGRLDGALDG